ncbi:MAG: molybdate ABC transporter substrate-binding protein, partial [Candidatus Dormibacteria bacterium]
MTILAAASLTEAFLDGGRDLQRAQPGFSPAFSFAGSQQLVTNVRGGAPADVVATADPESMQSLVAAGLVDAPRTCARNRLQIVVARGNPAGVHSLADLAGGHVAVVLADPSVPAGRLARRALQRAGVEVMPRSNELDVRAALQRVESHDADAAIVYATDVVSAGNRAEGVAIPDAQNVDAVYPIAVVRSTRNRAAADAFVD